MEKRKSLFQIVIVDNFKSLQIVIVYQFMLPKLVALDLKGGAQQFKSFHSDQKTHPSQTSS